MLESRHAQLGFWVPTGAAILGSLAGAYAVLSDPTNGYAALVFLVFGVYGAPAVLLYLLVGALVLRARGPPGSAKRFALGAAAGLGVGLLLLTVSCFGSLAL